MKKILILLSIIISLFLGYIDEGYNNFKWMLDWMNWISFVIYFIIIYFISSFIFNKLLKSKDNKIVVEKVST